MNDPKTSGWHPWDEFNQDVFDCPELPITGPPCAGCKFWAPRREFSLDGKFVGVRLCHAPDILHDFSCFRPREVKEKTPPSFDATILARRICAIEGCGNPTLPTSRFCGPACAKANKRATDIRRKRERRKAIPRAAAEAVVEAIVEGIAAKTAEQQQIDDWIAKNGVTRCPTPGTAEFYDLPIKPEDRSL